jgi:hypothetical protein
VDGTRAEISLYVRWFRSSHDDTADTAEGWRNLQFFLRPADQRLGPDINAHGTAPRARRPS